MKTIITIIARTNSTRLKQKVLKKINHQSIIGNLIDRMLLVFPNDDIYLCTSKHPDDSILVKIAKNKKIKYIAGSELAVIERMIEAADESSAENVIRVTGDNPLTDPFLLKDVINNHKKKKADYSIMTYLPRGATGDVIRTSALKKLYRNMDPNESQYLALYINNPSEYFVNKIKASPENYRPLLTFSVDTKSEFDDVSLLINNLGINKKIKYYIQLAENKEICRIDPNMNVKLSEEKIIPYQDYINILYEN